MDGFIIWLREVLDTHGLTQEELADCVGVSSGHVSKLLAGERLPGRKVMEGAAQAFPYEWLRYLRTWVPQDKERAPEQ